MCVKIHMTWRFIEAKGYAHSTHTQKELDPMHLSRTNTHVPFLTGIHMYHVYATGRIPSMPILSGQ